MRKTILASALLVFAQSTAHAQLMDLPDPGDMGSLPASETQAPVEHPPIQQGASFASSLRISSVSRATSGAFYNVAIQALTLSTLDLRATTRIKVYNVILKTSEGRSIEAREFRNGVFVEAGSVVSAGNLNLNEAVIEILIQAEAYGSSGDLILTVVSDVAVPKMRLIPSVTSAPSAPTAVNPSIETSPQAPTPQVASSKGLSVGDEVVSGPVGDGKYYTGRVVKIGRDGISVRDFDDNKIYVRDRAFIFAKVSECSSEGLCRGDKVLSGPLGENRYYSGVVVAIYTNNLIAIKDDDDGQIYYRKQKSVMKSARCHEKSGLCRGDKVLSGPMRDGIYYEGVVTGIYSNGLIYVKDQDDGLQYARQSNLVLKSVQCDSKKKICVGAKVKSGPYRGVSYSGRVVAVFQSDLVRVLDNDDGIIYTRKVKEVSLR